MLFQRPYTNLKVNGKVVATVRQSFLRPIWWDNSVDIYVGKEKAFSLWEDFCDSPIFIYPFPDGKRFLCDYDYDVAMLDFVVDFGSSATNARPWPVDGLFRGCTLGQVTNIVFDTEGVVRWPTDAELNEVTGYLEGTTSLHTKAAYFDAVGLGAKSGLLLDLATNRQSAWPMPE